MDNTHVSNDIIPLNSENIPDTTDRNLSIEMPIVATTDNECHETDQLVQMNDVDNVLLDNLEEVTRKLMHFNNC